MKNESVEFLTGLMQTGISYFWFIILAAWGGTVNYIRRVKKEGLKFSVVELIGEWSISAFAGIVTAFICHEMNTSEYLTYALVAISGHLGGKTIDTFETFFRSKIIK